MQSKHLQQTYSRLGLKLSTFLSKLLNWQETKLNFKQVVEMILIHVSLHNRGD